MSLALLIAAASCSEPKQDETVVADEWNTDSTQAININKVKTVLPQAGNVAMIEANCMPCHSLRYIEMQPEFTYKAWEKIVDKMINSYGAPIRDTLTRRHIINYLHAIKGEDGH